jgi:hypothetical protein
MAGIFDAIIGALGGLGLGLERNRQQSMQEQMAAAQMLQHSGTFQPIPPGEAGQQNPFMQLLGVGTPGQLQIGNQAFRHVPYPTMDLPGIGPISLTPELAMKQHLQQQENLGLDAAMQAILPPRAPGMPLVNQPIVEPSTAPAPSQGQELSPWRGVSPAAKFWSDAIGQASQETGVDPKLITAVMMQESSGNPNATHAMTSTGERAIGLMGLLPGTAKEMGIDPNDPRQNILGGARYLRQQLQRFGNDKEKALQAYFAGPETIARHGGVPKEGYPKTAAYAPSVMNWYNRLGGTAEAAPLTPTGPVDQRVGREIDNLDQEINRLEGVARTIGAKGTKGREMANLALQQITRLTTRRDRLEDQLTEPERSARKQAAELPGKLQEARGKALIETQQKITETQLLAPLNTAAEVEKATQLNQVYADRARLELEATADLKAKIAGAGREQMPVSKEVTDKVDALLTVKESIATIKGILSRRGADPNFAKGLKQFTGPLQGILTQYLKQPISGDDPDENDFVTALRTLQSQEIRATAGLAQTGSEVERAIGVIGGRLPVLFNPPDVFESRMKAVDSSTNRALQGMAKNLEGRAYGQHIQDYLKPSTGASADKAAEHAADEYLKGKK